MLGIDVFDGGEDFEGLGGGLAGGGWSCYGEDVGIGCDFLFEGCHGDGCGEYSRVLNDPVVKVRYRVVEELVGKVRAYVTVLMLSFRSIECKQIRRQFTARRGIRGC